MIDTILEQKNVARDAFRISAAGTFPIDGIGGNVISPTDSTHDFGIRNGASGMTLG